MHYDLTSVYFVGLYTESELVRFGYRRDQRPDSKRINLGLNGAREGLPLTFRVLVGNTADNSTPRENLEAVRKLFSEALYHDLTILHDRAMSTPETLVWYGQHDQKFVSPMTADRELQALLDGVPRDELLAHPLNCHPQRQRKESAPAEYYGVWREHRVKHESQSLQVRILVVHSVSRGRLDSEKLQTLLAQLEKRLAEIHRYRRWHAISIRASSSTGTIHWSRFTWPSAAMQRVP